MRPGLGAGRWSPSTRTVAITRPGKGFTYSTATAATCGGSRYFPGAPKTILRHRFSPDGNRLVFTRYRGTGRAEKAALFTVRLDGSDLHQLTSFAIHAGDADWSPDGKRIVFEAYPNPGTRLRRRLHDREHWRPDHEPHPQPCGPSGVGRSRLVARRAQDPIPRQPSRRRRGKDGARDNDPHRCSTELHSKQEHRAPPARLVAGGLLTRLKPRPHFLTKQSTRPLLDTHWGGARWHAPAFGNVS